jgi:hypothetical protein
MASALARPWQAVRGAWQRSIQVRVITATLALSLVVVDIEDADCRPADRGQSHQKRALPGEMVLPSLGARVEELHGLAGCGINSRQVTRFGEIAVDARQR